MPDGPSNADSTIQLRGNLLLADPSLRDGVFDHSVVLMTEHSAGDGAFGLILNHPTGRVVGDFITEEDFGPLKRIAVHQGGPVSPEQLTFSAFWWHQKAGLKWATRISAADAIKHSNRPGTIVRAFIGYSGWSPGQVEGELKRSAWIVAKPEASLLREEHDTFLWHTILRGLSPLHRVLAEAPPNPLLN